MRLTWVLIHAVHCKNVEQQITLIDERNHYDWRSLEESQGVPWNDTFGFTYGDGVADVDVKALVAHHVEYARLATVTGVYPPARYGALRLGDNASVSGFKEKPQGDGGWINGGFFVLEPAVIDRIADDSTIWEQGPLSRLSADGELTVYLHKGFGTQWTLFMTVRT